jgi:S-adenosylmethionine synthetase
MSMVATSGKNPINHIGKIYNLLSTQVARDCVAQVDGINEIYLRILSQIGNPIDQPLVASAQIIPKPGVKFKSVAHDVEGIIDSSLEEITCITGKVINGELNTF